MSRKKPTRWVGSSSVALTSSFRPRTAIVARPAARRLRTHWTSPQGAQTQRLPPTSIIARGVVRGRPLLRPRMVTSPLGPTGTPTTRRNFRIGLKNRTRRGRCVRWVIATSSIRSLICVAPFRGARGRVNVHRQVAIGTLHIAEGGSRREPHPHVWVGEGSGSFCRGHLTAPNVPDSSAHADSMGEMAGRAALAQIALPIERRIPGAGFRTGCTSRRRRGAQSPAVRPPSP